MEHRLGHGSEEGYPQSRTPFVPARLFSEVLHLVRTLGFLEILAGPWCYNLRVKEAAGNSADCDREGLVGEVTVPGDDILKCWVEEAKACNWSDGGWSPPRSLSVKWSDGEVRFYKADACTLEFDLQVIMDHSTWKQGQGPQSRGKSPGELLADTQKRFLALCRQHHREEHQKWHQAENYLRFMAAETNNYKKACTASMEWSRYLQLLG